MSSIAPLKKELDAAAKIKNTAERSVTIAALIAEALRSTGRDPVLVGGSAVEFYTLGGYSTSDIDFVADGGTDLWRLMKDLGFEKLGKDFVDRKRRIYVEFPSSHLKPGESYVTIQVDCRPLRIVTIEDLIVDRLCAYKFWKSGIDGVNALLLLELDEADEKRVLKRSFDDDVQDALKAVCSVREDVIRKKLSRKEANRLLEDRMRSLK